MRNFTFSILFLVFITSCDAGFKTLSSSIEGGMSCPSSKFEPKQTQHLLNAYEKNNKKVLLNKVYAQSLLPKEIELSVLLDLECLASNKNKTSFLSEAFRNLPKRDFTKYSKREAHTIKLPENISISQLNAIAQEDLCVLGVTEEAAANIQGLPNDPRYSEQSYLSSIKFPLVYEEVFTSQEKLTGEYIVAVIDTGYTMSHNDLKNRWWINPGEIPGNGIDDDNNGVIDDVHGSNHYYSPPSGDPQSISYAPHGTHVAGLIGAELNNSLGIASIMGANSKIMAINAWPISSAPGGGSGSIASIVDRSIRYAVDNGAQVINMSLSIEGSHPNVEDAMIYALQNNVIMVVAAGNDSKELNTNFVLTPASYAKDMQGLISVAATNSANGLMNAKCSFSNYSMNLLEIAAPGCDSNTGARGILSTVPTSYDASGYGYMQGTSMATPIVTAAALYTYALLKERANIEPSAALVEHVLKEGSSVNSHLVGLVQNAKNIDLKNIYDYIYANYISGPTLPECP